LVNYKIKLLKEQNKQEQDECVKFVVQVRQADLSDDIEVSLLLPSPPPLFLSTPSRPSSFPPPLLLNDYKIKGQDYAVTLRCRRKDQVIFPSPFHFFIYLFFISFLPVYIYFLVVHVHLFRPRQHGVARSGHPSLEPMQSTLPSPLSFPL
jgi:hypothetical protein